MINIDMWYGDDHKEADKIVIAFYDLDCEYRGNIYKNGKMIGDYTCTDSIELEKNFPQLTERPLSPQQSWGERSKQ